MEHRHLDLALLVDDLAKEIEHHALLPRPSREGRVLQLLCPNAAEVARLQVGSSEKPTVATQNAGWSLLSRSAPV